MIFWRKTVIFHTKYSNNFRASLRHWKKIWIFGVKSWFFTRNTPKIFAPLSAPRFFFKCAPPKLKSWIPPWYLLRCPKNLFRKGPKMIVNKENELLAFKENVLHVKQAQIKIFFLFGRYTQFLKFWNRTNERAIRKVRWTLFWIDTYWDTQVFIAIFLYFSFSNY